MKVERRRVGDILELKRTPIDIEPDKDYRRIGIYSWGKGFLHRPPTPGTEMGSLRYFTFPHCALVMSNIQAWEAAVAVSGDAEQGMVASNRFLPYVPRREHSVDLSYIKHYFLSDTGLEALRSASPGTQVRNRTLGRALFENLQVPLPGLPDQRRIAAHLDSIAENRTHFMRAQIVPSDVELIRKYAERFIHSHANAFWRAGVDFEIRGGGTPSDDEAWNGHVPWATPTDIGALRGARHLASTARQIDEIYLPRTGLIPRGSVVMTSRAPVGNIAINDVDLVTNQGCKTFVPLRDVNSTYLYFSVMSQLSKIFSMTAGTTFAEVSAKRLSTLELPICAPQHQGLIASHLAEVHDCYRAADKLRSQTRTLTRALLPAARNEVFSALR